MGISTLVKFVLIPINLGRVLQELDMEELDRNRRRRLLLRTTNDTAARA